MAAPLRQGECHLPPRRKEVSGPWVNAARPTVALLDLRGLGVKTEDPGPQDPLLLHSRAPSQATPPGVPTPPLGSRQRGSGFKPRSPGVGPPVLALPLPWPFPQCSLLAPQQNLTCHNPASSSPTLLKHLMYTQGCSHETEQVEELFGHSTSI